MANKIHVKKGDMVYVLSGKDKGRKGKILEVMPKDSTVIVEGVNMATSHNKPRTRTQQGGIIKKEAPLHSSNVLLICPKCGKPVKTGNLILANGKKARVCKQCNETLDISKETKEVKEEKAEKAEKAVKETKAVKEEKAVKETRAAKETKTVKTTKTGKAAKAETAEKTEETGKEE